MQFPAAQAAASSTVRVVHGLARLGSALVVARPFPKGAEVIRFAARVAPEKSRYTIQVGAGLHAQGDGDCTFVYMNHACRPTCAVMPAEPWRDPSPNERFSIAVVALRDLSENDPVTFDYNKTEWAMAEPFECACDVEERCHVAGFEALSETERSRSAAEGTNPPWPHLLQLADGAEASPEEIPAGGRAG